MKNQKVRTIAFYLPQFHPIPENDIWWGKGFTEWTNVAKAKPLFSGHYQPHIPADLGFYDLRVPEVREQQVEMAKYAGIEGFAYWHYWFAGRRLLERPFNEVLATGRPDFPFCLAWANESWSGIWHGNPGKTLIEQNYPGIEDYKNHFYAILDAFLDDRYIRVSGRPLFFVYSPEKIPDTKVFFDCWNELAIKHGLNKIYFVARCIKEDDAEKIINMGYDAIQNHWLSEAMSKTNITQLYWNRISRRFLNDNLSLDKWNYSKLSEYFGNELDSKPNYFPTILAGWDNSPRSGRKGRIFTHYTPESFDKHVKKILDIVKDKDESTNIVFLKSWNEWAEGNYVEPDIKYGRLFLDVLKNNLIL